MMSIEDIRRQNLRLAIEIAGSVNALADKAKTSPSYISQCASEKTKKSMGSKIARRIEDAIGLDKGWMDENHGDTQETGEEMPNADLQLLIKQLSDDEKDDLNEFIYLMIRKRKITEKYL